MFYRYRQNNSGGYFHQDDHVGVEVYIEAKDAVEADRLAENVGIYFHGLGDCSCCGNRWHHAWEEGENETPYEETERLPYNSLVNWMDETTVHIYNFDGTHEKFNVKREKLW